jgi:hypothetical protein
MVRMLAFRTRGGDQAAEKAVEFQKLKFVYRSLIMAYITVSF